jgi:hypothetical protein
MVLSSAFKSTKGQARSTDTPRSTQPNPRLSHVIQQQRDSVRYTFLVHFNCGPANHLINDSSFQKLLATQFQQGIRLAGVAPLLHCANCDSNQHI